MKERNSIGNVVNSKCYSLLLFFVSFVFVVLFSRSTSFLYVFEGADPAIFKQMGLALLRGKTLYIDYFDNKGCILYFIHALGLWLGGDFFILLMQTISLTVTLLIWDKMLALYRDERSRLIYLGIALFMLFCFYGAGDQTQEWCLPFISYPLLVYFRAYKKTSEIRPLQMFFIGLCFGIITFIQINNACAFLGFIAYLWLQYMLKKDFRKLFQSIGYFIMGWIIIVIPCVLYFYIKAGWNGVYEMVYATFLSNLEYIGVQHGTNWFHWLPYFMFVGFFLLTNILGLYKQREILVPILISVLLFIGTFGRLCNSFYLTALLPLCIVSMMTIDLKAKLVPSLIVVISALFIGSVGIFHFVNDLILRNEKEIAIYGNFHRCIENIPENERDSIFNYNLIWHGYGMMQHEKLLQCNRVSLGYDLPTLKEKTSKPASKPKWILITWNYMVKSDRVFINKYYDLVDSFPYDQVYFTKPMIGKKFEVCLYRRKD